MRRLAFWVFGLSALIGGCAGNTNHTNDTNVDALPDDVCAEQHRDTTSDGHDVVVCDALYTEAPFVHLPKLAAGHAFAGIVGTDFVTVDGASYGAAIASSVTSVEMTRHGVALYELEVAGNSVNDFAPVILFDESLFFTPFMGQSFEGVISRGDGAGKWIFEPSLPVRLDVSAQPVSGGSSYEADVTLANLNGAITASDGSCMPSLASYGTEAPFAAGATVDLRMTRVPSMHNFGDDHLVFTLTINGMPAGSLMGAWFYGPLDLVHGTVQPSGQYEGIGHGSPGSIPDITLEPTALTGGSAACSP